MAPMMMMATPSGRAAGGHVRSASVPSQRHPLLTDVDDQLRALRSWTSDPGQNPLALAHVRALLCVLDELLQHCYLSPTDDRLLDGFLALADAYGSFLVALLALRQHAAELRAAVRRRDPAKLASAARAQRRAAKELAGLAAAVARCAPVPTPVHSAAGASSDADVARTVAEAIGDTAAASASVFLQVASLADAAALAASSPSSCKKKHPSRSSNKPAAGEEQRDTTAAAAAAVAKLQELERCVDELESESEKVFRSLLQTRVSLLNIHTPTI